MTDNATKTWNAYMMALDEVEKVRKHASEKAIEGVGIESIPDWIDTEEKRELYQSEYEYASAWKLLDDAQFNVEETEKVLSAASLTRSYDTKRYEDALIAYNEAQQQLYMASIRAEEAEVEALEKADKYVEKIRESYYSQV